MIGCTFKGSFENYYGFSNVGIDSIGVLYGYGHRAELEKAGEYFIVNAVMVGWKSLFRIKKEEG